MSSGLLTLPNELLDSLAEHPTLGDLQSLCSTNRRLYAVCIRRIYSSVVLPDFARAVCFFRTAVSNNQAAALVRVLKIEIPFSGSGPIVISKSFGCSMRSALKNLTALVRIVLPPSTHILGAISNIRFPHLIDCAIPFCPAAAAFLQLHPTLKNLALANPDHAPSWPLVFPKIRLPNLKDFFGPAATAGLVIAGSPCGRATLWWDSTIQRQSPAVFSALRSSHLRELHHCVLVWDMTMISAIAMHAPNVHALRFSNRSSPPNRQTLQAFLSSVDDSIDAFYSLLTLHIESPAFPDSNLAHDLAFEFECVSQWGEACASLYCCVLPSETIWIRLPDKNIWFPSPKSHRAADFLERFHWLLTAAVCSSLSHRSPLYLQYLGTIHSKTELAALKVAYETQGVMPRFELDVESFLPEWLG
ncbi:hypothetical protein C8R46DRAFT_445950 [Mycena filopes]|nr:hypothetical protein C8R46DRAFT_445950 [Mycena filopes]